MIHGHEVYDTDTFFKIDRVSREITYPDGRLPVLVQGDHGSEIFSFQIPRYIDGHDMSLCNSFRFHYVNTGTGAEEVSKGYNEADSVEMFGDENIVCHWLIRRGATKYKGKFAFLLNCRCVDDDGAETYVWNTLPYKNIIIGEGINNAEITEEEYNSLLDQCIQEAVTAAKREINGLPTVGVEDNGKHMVVIGGQWKTAEQESVTGLPDVSAEDDGKFLQVVNGAWVPVAITDGNEVAY